MSRILTIILSLFLLSLVTPEVIAQDRCGETQDTCNSQCKAEKRVHKNSRQFHQCLDVCLSAANSCGDERLKMMTRMSKDTGPCTSQCRGTFRNDYNGLRNCYEGCDSRSNYSNSMSAINRTYPNQEYSKNSGSSSQSKSPDYNQIVRDVTSNMETRGKNNCTQITNSYATRIASIPIGSSINEQATYSIQRNNLTLEALNKCMRELPVGSQSYNEVRNQALAIKADNDQSLRILSQTQSNSRAVHTQPNWNGPNSTSSRSPVNTCPSGYYRNSTGSCIRSKEIARSGN